MLQSLSFLPQIFNLKERDWYTITIKQHNVETRKDQAKGRKDKGAGPSGVNQMETLAWLMGKYTASQRSWAGPCMQARLDRQAGQCWRERSRLSTRTYTVDRNRKCLILAKMKPNREAHSGLPVAPEVS